MSAPLWTALLWIAGCDSDDPCDLAAEVEPALELGQGEEAFEPLDEGDSMDAERGPQGGQHVWGALRARGISPGAYRLFGDDGTPSATIRLLSAASGEEIAVGRVRDVPWAGDTRQAEIVGVRAVLGSSVTRSDSGTTDSGASPTAAPEADEPVLLRAEVEDACGTHLEAELGISVRLAF